MGQGSNCRAEPEIRRAQGVLEGGADARYLPTGHLVYALNGVLFAVPFIGKAGDNRRAGGNCGRHRAGRHRRGAVRLFDTGSLIYIPGPVSATGTGQNVLGLVDRKGEVEALKVPPGAYAFPRISRDGKRVAYQVDDGKEASIWIYELSGPRPRAALRFRERERIEIRYGRRITSGSHSIGSRRRPGHLVATRRRQRSRRAAYQT